MLSYGNDPTKKHLVEKYEKLKQEVDNGEMMALPEDFLGFWKCVVATRNDKKSYEDASKSVEFLEEYHKARPMSKYPNNVRIRNPNGITDLLELYGACERLVMPWIDEVGNLEQAMKAEDIAIADVLKPSKQK